MNLLRLFLLTFGLIITVSASTKKPNVVLIICDDLNDYITGIPGQSGHPQAKTPNVEKLAQSGVAFRRAYSNNPVCAPSRASFLTGIYGHNSNGNEWPKWYNLPVLKNSKTLMHYFRDNGYEVVGSGKLMHFLKKDEWSKFKNAPDYGPFAYNGEKNVAHTGVPSPFNSIGPVDGSYGSLESLAYIHDGNPKTGWVSKQPWNWTQNPSTKNKQNYLNFSDKGTRSLTPDEANAKWAAETIQHYAQQEKSTPFFLGVGFIRPHTPLHVSQKYFDMFPLATLENPLIRQNDSDDCHLAENLDENSKGLKYFRLLHESYPQWELGIRAFTQAYLASVAAVDECIGQVVEAVNNSPLRDNTIIVLTSDHGWNMGQKDFLFKNSLWEESTRVPFIVRAPGVTQAGGIAEHPISLIDLYPTLVDLCGLEGDTKKNENGHDLDGFSVRPFLENPKANSWDGPEGALTTVSGKHWAIRTKYWRYIRYENGAEELYNHANDPCEWVNLADNPEFQPEKKKLLTMLLKQANLAE
ncbi:MAG TPA: sulfatase [Pontiella sp.]